MYKESGKIYNDQQGNATVITDTEKKNPPIDAKISGQEFEKKWGICIT